MQAILAKSYAGNSNQGNNKFVHAGRMYYKQRDLKGDNFRKVSAACDQRSISGCKGWAWFWEESSFGKLNIPKCVKL